MSALWAYAWHQFGPTPRLWLFCAHSIVFVLVFVIDLEHRLVLNRVVLFGITLALSCSLIWSSPPLARSALGGLSGFAIFLLIAMAKPGGMGAGDVKLAGLIGLVVGYPSVLAALFTGILVGGIGAAVLLLMRRVKKGGYLPYGPFMVVGVLSSLLRGEPL
jgi:prepilin signal peptidase PulO-like enzyme (type II secretory pathway)